MPSDRAHRRVRPAFSIIELLIVIGIIALLVALTIGIGASVVGGARERSSKDSMRVLETVLGTLQTDLGENPAAWTTDPEVDGQFIAIADGVVNFGGEQVTINSLGLFIRQAEQRGVGSSALSSLDPNIFRLRDPDGDATTGTGPTFEARTVLDPWGNPLRYVHPTFDGDDINNGTDGTFAPIAGASANGRFFSNRLENQMWRYTQVRREATELNPDSDGGTCIGDQPYFYSAGPDGNPQTTEDNVYTAEPTLPQS